MLIPFTHAPQNGGRYGAFACWGTERCFYMCTLVASEAYWPFAYHERIGALDMFISMGMD